MASSTLFDSCDILPLKPLEKHKYWELIYKCLELKQVFQDFFFMFPSLKPHHLLFCFSVTIFCCTSEWCLLRRSRPGLGENYLCEEPATKYSGFCRPDGLGGLYSTLLLYSESRLAVLQSNFTYENS